MKEEFNCILFLNWESLAFIVNKNNGHFLSLLIASFLWTENAYIMYVILMKELIIV